MEGKKISNLTSTNHLLYFLTRSVEFLKRKGIPNPRLDAEILLSHVLGIPRIQLYTSFEMPLSESEQNAYRELIRKRGERVPTAYLVGKKNFYGFDFLVNEKVLIPRPETEELVERAVLLFQEARKKFPFEEENSILDLCCGSGCIGITLALLIKDFSLSIHFADISSDALEVCRQNWNSHELNSSSLHRAEWIESDLFENIPTMKQYFCILSNPPYILPDEEESLMSEVKKEPRIALIGDHFLEFHTEIFRGSKDRLQENGFLLLETNPRMIGMIIQLSKNFGYNSSIVRDFSGKDRFLLCHPKN